MSLRKPLLWTAIVVSSLIVVLLIVSGAETSAPVQPVAFSHRLHAGKYEINCLFCHWRADERLIAGIPSVERCVDCHRAQGKSKKEWKKLERYWKERKPVPWVKVNDLPDFVSFNHKRHIKADVSCLNCHGSVYTMDRLKKVGEFTMTRCMRCMQGYFKKAGSPASIDCPVCHK